MNLKDLSKKFYINLIFVVIIFILDRVSKIYVIYLTNKSFETEIFLSKFLNISLIWNKGIAFGLLSFDQNYLYNFITTLILVVVSIIFVMIIKSEGIQKCSLIMIMGGAVGNLYDRIFYKAVPDFIDFHINEIHWFIFNVADIFITIGVTFMILFELINNNKKKNV